MDQKAGRAGGHMVEAEVDTAAASWAEDYYSGEPIRMDQKAGRAGGHLVEAEVDTAAPWAEADNYGVH